MGGYYSRERSEPQLPRDSPPKPEEHLTWAAVRKTLQELVADEHLDHKLVDMSDAAMAQTMKDMKAMESRGITMDDVNPLDNSYFLYVRMIVALHRMAKWANTGKTTMMHWTDLWRTTRPVTDKILERQTKDHRFGTFQLAQALGDLLDFKMFGIPSPIRDKVQFQRIYSNLEEFRKAWDDKSNPVRVATNPSTKDLVKLISKRLRNEQENEQTQRDERSQLKPKDYGTVKYSSKTLADAEKDPKARASFAGTAQDPSQLIRKWFIADPKNFDRVAVAFELGILKLSQINLEEFEKMNPIYLWQIAGFPTPLELMHTVSSHKVWKIGHHQYRLRVTFEMENWKKHDPKLPQPIPLVRSYKGDHQNLTSNINKIAIGMVWQCIQDVHISIQNPGLSKRDERINRTLAGLMASQGAKIVSKNFLPSYQELKNMVSEANARFRVRGAFGAAIGPEEELAEDIVFGLTSTAGAGIMSDPALGASVSMIGMQTHDYLWDARKGSKNPLSNKIEAPPGYYDEDDHPKVKIGNKMLGVGDKVIDLEFGHQGDIISWGNTKDPVVLFQTGVSPHEGHKPIIDKVRASKLKPGL